MRFSGLLLLLLLASPALAQPAGARVCTAPRLTLTPADAAALRSAALRSGSYACDPAACRLPDCHCASTEPPGGLDPADVPQFLLVTWDDLVNAETQAVADAVTGGLLNPDGATAPLTYFVNVDWTDPAVVAGLYAAGHEIANHTASHDTDSTTTMQEWVSEIVSTTHFLREQAGVPVEQVAGFRAPYLAPSTALWDVLDALGFRYDATLTEVAPSLVSTGADAYVWPFTLDAGLPLPCFNGGCPEGPLPGLWEIPLWTLLDETGAPVEEMDPGLDLDPAALRALLDHNFEQHYAGNRAPLGLFLHVWYMEDPERRQVFRDFLTDALARPDTWMITARGLIEWMRAPVPASEMAGWFAAGCHRGGCAPTTAGEEPPLASALRASVYPNPSTADATLAVEGISPGSVTVEVFDVLGRRVYGRTAEAAVGRLEQALPLGDLPAGLYFYRVRTAAGLTQGRIVRS